MAPQCPLIQSFFQPSPAAPVPAVTNADENDDGFTTTEVKAFLYSTPHAWKPRVQYENTHIAALAPGPHCVCVLGRVVNFYDQPTSTSKLPYATKRCLNVLLRDDTGMIKVKLWYLKVDYQLRLGQLVSVWTSLISGADTSGSVSVTIQNAACTIDIFPERDNRCYFMVHADKDDGPLSGAPHGYGYDDDKQPSNLKTLKRFIEGGYDVPTAKVLVCVKSIGGRKKRMSYHSAIHLPRPVDLLRTVATKKGSVLDVVNVIIFDETYDATLALCGRVATSAAYWKTSNTVLLLANPGFRSDKRPTLSITPNTWVEIDPCLADAEWLRAFAQRLTTREHVNLGTLIDESGAISSGKLVFSTEAWGQLLGRTTEELARCDTQLLKYLENRILFMRLTLLLGWNEK
ncbi:MAG: hypothetical protein Q9224_003792, partial [Gallowayella concinna]